MLKDKYNFSAVNNYNNTQIVSKKYIFSLEEYNQDEC